MHALQMVKINISLLFAVCFTAHRMQGSILFICFLSVSMLLSVCKHIPSVKMLQFLDSHMPESQKNVALALWVIVGGLGKDRHATASPKRKHRESLGAWRKLALAQVLSLRQRHDSLRHNWNPNTLIAHLTLPTLTATWRWWSFKINIDGATGKTGAEPCTKSD